MNEMDKGCRNYSPMPDNRSVFEKAGFQKREWVKIDPRGSEYGCYTAEILGGNLAGWIEVTHTKNNYRMKFSTNEDFLNWSRSV